MSVFIFYDLIALEILNLHEVIHQIKWSRLNQANAET